MKRENYPVDWESRALACKERAGWRCEGCGRECRKPGEVFDTHRRTLTASHKNHDEWNAEAELWALCAWQANAASFAL